MKNTITAKTHDDKKEDRGWRIEDRSRASVIYLLSSILFASLCVSATLHSSIAFAQTTQPEIRRGLPNTTQPGERFELHILQLAQKAEPSLHGDPARLNSYIEIFKRFSISDQRMTAFDARAEVANNTVTLTGFSEYPELVEALLPYLNKLGFQNIANHVELLPAKSLGGIQGLIRVSKATIYDKPIAPRESLTQVLLGDAVFLLKEQDGHYLVHSNDGYVGYLDQSAVKRVDAETLRKYQEGWQGTILQDSGLEPDFLPAGAKLKVVKNRSSVVTVELPEGKHIELPAERVNVVGNPSPIIEKVIELAKQTGGAPYVWGGRTSSGIDCSGLIQTAFGAQGLRLPRDADQQALCGTLVATRAYRGGLRRGDLLFFLGRDGSVHHVAIYLGDNQFIQSVDKGVHISSFNPEDKNYDKKHDESFVFAKRIID